MRATLSGNCWVSTGFQHLHRWVAVEPCQALPAASIPRSLHPRFPCAACDIAPSGSLRLDQQRSGPAAGTRFHHSLVNRVTQHPAHFAGSRTGVAKLHHAMGICVLLVRFGSHHLGTSVSKDHQGPADAISAFLSPPALDFYSLQWPPVPLQRGAHAKCHPIAPKASQLLAGGWKQDQRDGCSGRIAPKKPNFGPSAGWQSRGWSCSCVGGMGSGGSRSPGSVLCLGAPAPGIPHGQVQEGS